MATCDRCLAALKECPVNEHGWHVADRVFEVGNPACGDMGHLMYRTHDGRIALCIARRKDWPEIKESFLV